ncbi:site-specific integrase [Streptomyces sp. SAI-229]|uniref:site-specific integrase n=1 Tax=Streptomyces sp. SAI-229 TaxID=3377731 RepID=UPI003C7B82F3
MADSVAVEVVDAELVDEDENRALPALADAPAHRPLIGRHTLLRPDAPIPTTADQPTYTAADFRISQKTADLLDGAPPANTSRTYGSALRQFRTWCAENGRVPMPCTTATFVEYVGHLVRRDLAPASVQVHMSAIRSAHPDGQQPGTKEARQLLRGHARDRARRRAPRKAPPIRTPALSAMVATCTAADGREQPKDLRDAALLTLGWGMLSRRSELANLLIEHLIVEDDGVTVRVAFSKTDQAAHGEDTFVPADPEVPSLCPVVHVRAWLEELRRHGITSGPLFRHITRGGTIRPRSGPRGDFLSPDAIGDIVKTRARLAGVQAPGAGRTVTAHGLRRGPAQEIAEAGGDPTAQGRWKPGSPTVLKHYIEPARGRTNNPLHAVRAKSRAGTAI